jgi:hypothetical protein
MDDPYDNTGQTTTETVVLGHGEIQSYVDYVDFADKLTEILSELDEVKGSAEKKEDSEEKKEEGDEGKEESDELNMGFIVEDDIIEPLQFTECIEEDEPIVSNAEDNTPLQLAEHIEEDEPIVGSAAIPVPPEQLQFTEFINEQEEEASFVQEPVIDISDIDYSASSSNVFAI